MKLKYELQVMEVSEEYVAVPVGDNADEFHAMIKLNKEAVDMLDCIKTSNTPDEVLNKMLEKYPNEERKELGQNVCDFLNQLIKEGLLEP